MGIRKVIKKSISIGFQPKRWLGLEHVKANGKICVDLVNDLIAKPQAPSVAETQAAQKALEHIHSTSKTLQARRNLALGLTSFYFSAGLMAVAYTLYLWIAKSFILAGFVSFIMAFLIFSYGLREFMVYAQIRCGRGKLPLKELLRQLRHKAVVK